VPAGGARRGRRDNGLSAAEYAAVGDVDPRVGEHLLDVLAGAGIAAYLQPATDLHPVTRTTTLPARPTDRLFADREHLDTAKDLLARLRADERGPGAGLTQGAAAASEPLDVEAAWAGIVAGFNDRVDSTAARWPAAEDLADSDDDREPDEAPLPFRPAGMHTADESPPSLLDALDTFGADLPDEDEGYTPPPPPPLPRPSGPTVLAILAVIGGLVVFFSPGLLPVSNNLALLIGFAALLTGVVTLIWRLRSGDDEDDDPDDDGAVV
jgi:hypothetical protein